jgi:lipopolysaccharide/colanic/teichoic acid biosynthesis glycosyltransferase|tara:strand:- start:136 stop:729 length:594 start_codon:yes stop_codon:yes gene_type:complete
MKQFFDFITSFCGLILLSPIFVLTALWIKIDSKGPIFFRQERVGFQGVPFRIHKFRTMVSGAEKIGKQISIVGDSRITTSGGFLRKYKLDELPQLIDVVVGEMSLVGPRPEVLKYIDYYSDDEKQDVLSVKPGITDNASIEFRDENDLLASSKDPESTYINEVLPKKIALYRKYVKERSFFGDIAIIFKTIFLIIKK